MNIYMVLFVWIIEELLIFCILGVFCVDVLQNYQIVESYAILLFIVSSVLSSAYLQRSQILFEFIICNILSSVGVCLLVFSNLISISKLGCVNVDEMKICHKNKSKLFQVVFCLYVIIFWSFFLQLDFSGTFKFTSWVKVRSVKLTKTEIWYWCI